MMSIRYFLLIILSVFINHTLVSQKKTIYMIPGQGSDYRIFKHFIFEEYDTAHIPYLIPEEDETMREYAERLSEHIDTDNRFSIIGVSLGGMLAVEMSEFLEAEEVIIISSAKNRNELPVRYKFMKTVPLNRIFNGGFIQAAAPTAQLIVEPDSKNERELCVSMLNSKDEIFMKRSVNMIINWNRTSNNSKIIHIHGDSDHTIPIRNVKSPDFVISGGSHMMALTRGDEIVHLINSKIMKQ